MRKRKSAKEAKSVIQKKNMRVCKYEVGVDIWK
jgi:hypothetical protein